MTLRNNYTEQQRKAASILDGVKVGVPTELRLINWALLVLGESAY